MIIEHLVIKYAYGVISSDPLDTFDSFSLCLCEWQMLTN